MNGKSLSEDQIQNQKMKKIILGLIVSFPLFCIAQANSPDSLQIVETCHNYVEGFYLGDAQRVSQAVHPELVKRIVAEWEGDFRISNMGSSDLILAAKHFKKPADQNPQEAFKITVVIYDISQNIAMAKIISNKLKFFDYVQVAKISGQWKIINVLWALTK